MQCKLAAEMFAEYICTGGWDCWRGPHELMCCQSGKADTFAYIYERIVELSTNNIDGKVAEAGGKVKVKDTEIVASTGHWAPGT